MDTGGVVPDSSRESHGHSNADSRALHSDNGGFATFVNRQSHSTTTVPILVYV